MAQQPGKLRWKQDCWYGLSASQFGMALGFSGRVSDFIDYLRNVVGTEQEFKGNAFTNHGIVTEPKARALYEMLTGSEVHDGGFFLAHGRLLGCSPDGQIFYHEDTIVRSSSGSGTEGVAESPHSLGTSSPQTPASPFAVCNNAPWMAPRTPEVSGPPSRCGQQPLTAGVGSSRLTPITTPLSATTQCAVRIPFTKKRSRSSGSNVDAHPAGLPHTAVHSPSLGVTSRPSLNAPGGDGTLTLRTRRRRLLEIKSPYRALYDCKKKEYQPFGIPSHYMCQMQGQMAIADAEECDFFVYLNQPCQVEAWRVRRSRAFWAWAEPKLLSVVAWTRDGPPDWLNRTFAFEPFDFSTLVVEPLVFPFDISLGQALRDAQRFRFFCQYVSPHDGLIPSEPPQGTTAARWQPCGGGPQNALACPVAALHTANAVGSDAVRFLFCLADNTPNYTLETLADSLDPETGHACPNESTVDADPTSKALTSQRFAMNDSAAAFLEQLCGASQWNSLRNVTSSAVDMETPGEQMSVVVLAPPTDWEAAEILVGRAPFVSADARLQDEAAVDSLLHVRCFHQSFFSGLTRVETSALSRSNRSECDGDDVDVPLVKSQPQTPLSSPTRHPVPPNLLQRTPVRDAVPAGESLSQHIRLSLTPRHDQSPSHVRDDPSSPAFAPQMISEDNLLDLVRFAEDCQSVWLVSAKAETGQHGCLSAQRCVRAFDVDREGEDDAQTSLFTLVIGLGDHVRQVVTAALTGSHELSAMEDTSPNLAALIADLQRSVQMCGSAVAHKQGLVLCYVEESLGGVPENGDVGVFPPVPCFVVRTSASEQIMARCLELAASWSR